MTGSPMPLTTHEASGSTPVLARRARAARQILLLFGYRIVARTGLLSTRPVEALFLRAYFRFKRRHEADALRHLATRVTPDSTVIDIGANAGYFTCEFASWARVQRVISIEPEATNLRRLQRAIDRRGIGDRVRLVRGVASDVSGKARLAVSTVHHGDHRIARDDDGTVVDSYRVDDLVGDEPGRVSAIKIDVQGAERRVLAGAHRTLVEHAPAVLVEVDEAGLGHYGDTLEDLLVDVAGIGYVAHSIAAATPEPIGDVTDLRQIIDATGEGYTDVLLLPTARTGVGPRSDTSATLSGRRS